MARRIATAPPGNYAFITPDTTFQKVYNGIMESFASSVKTDGYLDKIKFYADSARAIYINGIMEHTLEIVFKEIAVTSKTANITFFTTSLLNDEKFRDRYILVTGCLRNEHGKWKVEKFEMKQIGWTEYFRRKFIGKPR